MSEVAKAKPERGTVFPHRRVNITVEHPSIGEDWFVKAWYQAIAELAELDPMGTRLEHTASNGMKITIDPEPME